MCQSLLSLCEFVESTGAASRADVIRAACNRCDRVEVCAAVTEWELDGRDARTEERKA